MRRLAKMYRIVLEWIRILRTPYVIREGIRFLWTFRNKKQWWKILPPREYVMWRLGTVYGTHPEHDGTRPPKTLKQLLGELWDDREQAKRYLLWRRAHRKSNIRV